MADNIIDYYIKQDVVIQDHLAGSESAKCAKMRWDNMMIEAVDMDDEYVLCTVKAITKETIDATPKNGSSIYRYYIIKDGAFYRVVQSRILTEIEGDETYRELLLAPVVGTVFGSY